MAHREVQLGEGMEKGGAVFALLAGAFLGLTLLKFGNPAILDRLVHAPTSLLTVLIEPWPLRWAYGLFAVLLVIGLVVADWRLPSRHWLIWLPLVWLVWQGVSALTTLDGRLTRLTLAYFLPLVCGFYLGLFALRRTRRPEFFLAGLLVSFVLVLWQGLEQHFGGLAATRRYVYSQPGWQQMSPEYLKRLASNRIFSTLFYPNTFAGVILLLLPAMIVATYRLTSRLTDVTRGVLTALVAGAGLACLYWSGSKAGWLIALVLGVVLLLHQRFSRRWKLAIVVALVVVGMAGFAVRFAGYFAKGATSVSARMDYWRAAWETFEHHPLLGSGPGTFAFCYRLVKPPEAEMSLLTHNDYLEQASDSGLPGAVAYAVFVLGSLAWLYRRSKGEKLTFALWLGLVGWALQSGVEFGLYVPAVGWVAFWLLGWLWALTEGAIPRADTKPAR